MQFAQMRQYKRIVSCNRWGRGVEELKLVREFEALERELEQFVRVNYNLRYMRPCFNRLTMPTLVKLLGRKLTVISPPRGYHFNRRSFGLLLHHLLNQFLTVLHLLSSLNIQLFHPAPVGVRPHGCIVYFPL